MSVEVAEKTLARPSPRLPALAAWVVAIAIIIAGGSWGLQQQAEVWRLTEPIRFVGDISNAYRQGQRASEADLLKTYDAVSLSTPWRHDGVQNYGLDYPPLRLAVATWWYDWTRERFPDRPNWQNTYEFNAPLLMMNRAFLVIAAGAVFGLVHMARRWRAAERMDERPGAGVGAIAGACAAMLVWLSPPALLIGFGWPQWDICVPAFFLAALYAGCRNAWLSAGLLLAVGAMFKGQVLVGLPVMLIWPIVAGRWGGLARLLAGLLLGAGLVAAPFAMRGTGNMVRSEVSWFALSMLVPWGLAVARRQMEKTRREPRPTMSAIRGAWWIVPVAIAIWVCALAGLIAGWYAGAVIGGCMAAFIFWAGGAIGWRYQAVLPAIGIAVAIWTSALLSGASWTWLHIGFLYGADHYPAMTMGAPSNLPSILSQFGIRRPEEVALIMPEWIGGAGGYEVTWKVLLRSIVGVGSMMCGVAMGVHFRRRDPRFLLAAATMWLLFVTFPAQIHERYILYPALASATLLALGFGWTFMHIAISLIAVLPVLQGMLPSGHRQFLVEQMGPEFGTQLLRHVQATHPGMGWALITITLVCLWKTMDLRRAGELGRGGASTTLRTP